MSRFTDLEDWYISLGRAPYPPKYRTTKDLPWEVGRTGSGLTVTVPAPFAFNVSTPWLLRFWIRPTDARYHKAACLHDYLLEAGWDRVSSAAAFSDALKADGVGRAKRLAMTLGVIAYNWK